MLIDKCSAEEKERIENAVWGCQQVLNELYNKYGLQISVACYTDTKEVREDYSCVFVHDDTAHMIMSTDTSHPIKGMFTKNRWSSTTEEEVAEDE